MMLDAFDRLVLSRLSSGVGISSGNNKFTDPDVVELRQQSTSANRMSHHLCR
jgi:hypothetical protein